LLLPADKLSPLSPLVSLARGIWAFRGDFQRDQVEDKIVRSNVRAMPDYKKIFAAVTHDPRYRRNLDWGMPRPGHPEGTIRAHIAEIERNLETLRHKVSEVDYWRLRLLTHTHDTFKGEAQPGAPINSPNSHASLARAFLADHCDDADLLAMVQYHDEPFTLWQQFASKGKFNQERLSKLLASIIDWDLFLAFNIADGCTQGKAREPLRWLFRQVAGKVETKFAEADIL
jgi:hypothetical protein